MFGKRKHRLQFLVVTVVTASLFYSCSEPFNEIDPSAFNETISTRNDIATGAELIQLYADQDETALGTDMSIHTEDFDESSCKVTLIEQGKQNGLPFIHKVVMVAQRTDFIWKVYGIKENWKFRKNGRDVAVTAMR